MPQRLAQQVPAGITTLSTADYRNPAALPDGGVLVVGASASGIQIAHELHRSGRPVTLAVGEHVRMPRTYRGRDILWWMDASGLLDERYDEVPDLLRARNLPSMQLVGTPERATLDLNALRTLGVRLVGRLAGIRDGTALFSGSLPNVCALADLKLGRLLDTIDAWAARAGIGGDQPPQRFAPTEVPAPVPLSLDLRGGEIASIVWATGYRPELSWLHVPVLDRKGRVVHDGGVTAAPGLYLIGMPFLRRRKSSLIDGAAAGRGRADRPSRGLPRHARRGPSATAPRPGPVVDRRAELKGIVMHTPTRSAASIAAAVACRDGGRLAAALTDTVRLRALLPGGPVESHGRDAVVARFAGWFADFDTVELVERRGRAGGRPAARALPAHPAVRDHPLGLHADADLQDRRRPAGHPRPAVFRLPRDQRQDRSKGDDGA